MYRTIFLTCAALLTLTGCFDRAAADARLAKACAAGADAIIERPEESKLKGPDNIQAAFSKDGMRMRRIDMSLTVDDGWYATTVPVRCIFTESIGMMGGHAASLHYIRAGEQERGKKEGRIIGDMEAHLALTGAVNEALK
jgi:hypothetical protein